MGMNRILFDLGSMIVGILSIIILPCFFGRMQIMKRISIIGGTGFVGRALSIQLSNQGYAVNLVSRRPDLKQGLAMLPHLTYSAYQAEQVQSLHDALAGSEAVIFLSGVLKGSPARFNQVHAKLPINIMTAAQQAGVKRYLHMSALGAATHAPSAYLRSKGAGEQAVLEHAQTFSMDVTLFRPSIIFGEEDAFFNQFASLLRCVPILPLPCPYAKMQPVYVNDVAQAFINALTQPQSFNQRYDLGGPRVATFMELIQTTARWIGRNPRQVVGMPNLIAQSQAKLTGWMPGAPFTMDNYLSLQKDNVCESDGLAALGITATDMEAIMPAHFMGKSSRAALSQYRQAARTWRP